jgi:hypothetical protein
MVIYFIDFSSIISFLQLSSKVISFFPLTSSVESTTHLFKLFFFVCVVLGFELRALYLSVKGDSLVAGPVGGERRRKEDSVGGG